MNDESEKETKKWGRWTKSDQLKETLQLLIDQGVPVTVKEAEGSSVLHYALKNGCASWAIQILLNADAVPVEKDPKDNSALHHLARQLYKDTDFGDRFTSWQVERDVNIIDYNRMGETCLFNYLSSIPSSDSAKGFDGTQIWARHFVSHGNLTKRMTRGELRLTWLLRPAIKGWWPYSRGKMRLGKIR